MERNKFLEMAKEVAASYKNKGYQVGISHKLPTIGINGPEGEDIFFTQEEEATKLLEEVPDDMDEEVYILFILDSAGIL